MDDEASKSLGLASAGMLRRRQVLRWGAELFASVAAGKAWSSSRADATCGVDVESLASRLRGAVVSRGSRNFDAWRDSMVWQPRKFARSPDLIVQAEDVTDVKESIRFAARHGLRVTTRGGGHSFCGCFLRDNGLLVDVSRLQSIEIDATNRRAVVGPGVIGRALNAALAEHELAFPTAHCGMVPISGFLLGGGLGWNVNAWGGMATFNILGLDLVTADGRLRHASATENADLFWAARGCGPGLFAVVVGFHLQCFPLPRAITVMRYAWPLSALESVVRAMDDIGPRLNRNVELIAAVVTAPAALQPRLSDADGGRMVVMSATAFADSGATAASWLKPIEDLPLGESAILRTGAMPVDFEWLYHDNEVPFPQRRYAMDAIWTNEPVRAASIVKRHIVSAPSPDTAPLFLYKGEDLYPDAAYSRSGRVYISSSTLWDRPADDQVNLSWLHGFYDEMQGVASGHYINELDMERRPEAVRTCFSEQHWPRIRRIRERHDPNRVFQDFLGWDDLRRNGT